MYFKGFVLFFLLISIHINGQETRDFVLANIQNIRTINPVDTDFNDLLQLKEAIGNAKVVMLGEQDHGDAPCFMAKTRIIKFLHEKAGFDVLAFESDFYALNRQYEKNKENPEKTFKSIYSIWTQCQQNEEIFSYISKEAKTSNPLIVTGLDVRHSSPFSKENLVREIDSMLKTNEVPFYTSSYKNFKPVLSELLENEYQSKADSAQKLIFFNSLDTIQSQLSSMQFSNKSFWMQELKNLREFGKNSWSNLYRDTPEKNVRDIQMGDNLLWLLKEKYPDKKVIVWAHNFHISRNINEVQNIQKRSKNPYVTMGDVVHQELKDNVYVIGFDSYAGNAGRIVYSKPYKIKKPKKDCFESWIKEKGYPYAFLSLKNYNKEVFFNMKGLSHMSSSGKWASIFDGIFYIEQMYACTKKE